MRTTTPVRSQPLTNKPGEFRAVCRLARRIPEAHMSPEERQEAKAGNYPRTYNTNLSKPRWEVAFPECEGFETTDREEFERHIAEQHNGGPMRYDTWNGGVSKTHSMPIAIPVRMWPATPRKAPAEGRPLSTKSTDVETCETCGLVAEVDGTNGSDLWWAEHRRGCALAVQDGAA